MPWKESKYNALRNRESVKALRRMAKSAPGIVHEMLDEFLVLDEAGKWCGERFTLVEGVPGKFTEKQAKTLITKCFHSVGPHAMLEWIDDLAAVYNTAGRSGDITK